MIEEFRYEEEKILFTRFIWNKIKINCFKNFEAELSINNFGDKQSIEYKDKDKQLNSNLITKPKIHCIDYIVINLFRIVISQKEIKIFKEI